MTDHDRGLDSQLEIPLSAGRVTPGVVRIGDTVRRPRGPHSGFVHDLLSYLERVGFDGAPRFLGIDERGREILSFIEGDVPDNLDRSLTDDQLVAAAELLRRYHDATAGAALAGNEEVVSHNDVSPVNTVFVASTPVAMFDFDMAAPGPRIRDVSYAALLWLNLGWDGREPNEQRRRLVLWCDAYGLSERSSLMGEIKARILETTTRRRGDGAESAARWWHHQVSWIDATRLSSEDEPGLLASLMGPGASWLGEPTHSVQSGNEVSPTSIGKCRHARAVRIHDEQAGHREHDVLARLQEKQGDSLARPNRGPHRGRQGSEHGMGQGALTPRVGFRPARLGALASRDVGLASTAEGGSSPGGG